MGPIVQDPYEVMPGVFCLHQYMPVPGFGLMPVQAYLVKGEQPYLVDTGLIACQGAFIEQLGSLIDLADLRWIYLTHDDRDHVGAMASSLERAPNARVITTFTGMGRMSLSATPLAPPQVYFLNQGETLDLGDRTLTVNRPPIFDTPATTGFFDSKLDAYFSSDSFGGPVEGPVTSANAIPAEALAGSQLAWSALESPWVHHVADEVFAANVNEIAKANPEWILSTHMAPAKGLTQTFCKTLLKLPGSDPFMGPNQAAFEKMLAQMGPPPGK